jgi:hypothetical protein
MIDVENLTIEKAKELGFKKIILVKDLNSILDDKLVPKSVKDYYSTILNYLWIIPDELVEDLPEGTIVYDANGNSKKIGKDDLEFDKGLVFGTYGFFLSDDKKNIENAKDYLEYLKNEYNSEK